ncbi:MAG: hypothetical protein Q8W44_02290 [Candidatus Palauibacterales bacterium]|nr:hypothetical protein [Candidatus Palauibacterales bacterium]
MPEQDEEQGALPMNPPDSKSIEEALISDVLGWSLVEDPEEADSYPAAYWSPAERCFVVRRLEGRPPERFSPTRCFEDVWEVRERLGGNAFFPRLARPVSERNVRVVADCGPKEVVAEARSVAWALAMAIYQARSEQLI